MTAAVRIILIHSEPELDQIEAGSKNIPRAVYKSGDGVDLPGASTFTLHATSSSYFIRAARFLEGGGCAAFPSMICSAVTRTLRLREYSVDKV